MKEDVDSGMPARWLLWLVPQPNERRRAEAIRVVLEDTETILQRYGLNDESISNLVNLFPFMENQTDLKTTLYTAVAEGTRAIQHKTREIALHLCAELGRLAPPLFISPNSLHDCK
jgi:hypothetical protein